eukprot:1750115-Pyramimonas_sp.AAC.1
MVLGLAYLPKPSPACVEQGGARGFDSSRVVEDGLPAGSLPQHSGAASAGYADNFYGYGF